MTLAPQVAIGTLDTWHDLEVITDEQRPKLERGNRDLLPGGIGYRYWTVTIGMPGGSTETVTGRLLLHNAATSPPARAVLVPPGEHRTWVRVPDSPENEPVAAGFLNIK